MLEESEDRIVNEFSWIAQEIVRTIYNFKKASPCPGPLREAYPKQKQEINLKSKLWNRYKQGNHMYAMLSAFPEEAVCGLHLDDNLETMKNSFMHFIIVKAS